MLLVYAVALGNRVQAEETLPRVSFWAIKSISNQPPT